MGKYEQPFILKITDGTDEVDLVGGTDGITLKDWKPESAKYKGGGSMQDSPLADGRRIVNKQFDNVVDIFDLVLSTNTPDGAIQTLSKLRMLLERAAEYWIDNWQNNVVYLVCQYRGETNTRYASIVKGRIPNDEYPFGQKFQKGGMRNRRSVSEIKLVTEHNIWQSTIPGTGDNTAVSAVESFNGINLGNVNLTGVRSPSSVAGEVFVANHHKIANITHAKREINPGGVYVDIMNQIPANLITATVGLSTYFGCDTSVTDSGPFSSLIFDITTATSATALTVLWQYWNGATWTNISNPIDKTLSGVIGFGATGINGVFWIPPTDWATTTIDAITAYWVRLNVTVVTAVATNAIQGNRNIYTVSWSYTEFQESEISGVIRSLLRGRFENETIFSSGGETTSVSPTRLYAGLRRYDRGDSFQAFLNASDEQNPSGITVTLGASGTFATSSRAPTGRRVDFAPAGSSATFEDAVEWEFDSTISPEFYGTYMAFVRIGRPAGISDGDFTFKLAVVDTTTVETAVFDLTDTNSGGVTTPQVIALGTVKIPNANIHIPTTLLDNKLILRIAPVAGATKTIYIYDIVLIPTDEMGFYIDDSDPGSFALGASESEEHFEVDSLVPRIDIYSDLLVLRSGSLIIKRFYRVISNGPLTVHEKRRQRMWFLLTSVSVGNYSNSEPAIALSMDIDKAQRYLTARGAD